MTGDPLSVVARARVREYQRLHARVAAGEADAADPLADAEAHLLALGLDPGLALLVALEPADAAGDR